MNSIVRRVWSVTIAAVLLFAVYEAVKSILFPDMPVITSHVVTVIVAGILAFFVSRYALTRYNAALAQIERQTEMTKETNQLLSAVLAAMREGVVIVNSQMEVVHYNDAAVRVVKLPGEKGDTDLPLRLVDTTRDPAVNKAFRRAIEGQTSVEARVELADRDARSFQLNVAPLGNGLTVGVFFDITQLEGLERVRREFFANLSHELRTPLTAILAYSETLLDGAIDDPENRARFLENLHRQALRMGELVSDISDLSAIESGQVTLSLGPVGLRGVVTDTIALTESRHKDLDVSFAVSVPEEFIVQADRARLEQILYNLIDNAVKFNRAGGSVCVAAEQRDGLVAIHVEDTGTGIAESDQPRVFERLYRADKSRSHRVEGTGLGLAIVKHLVQAHGGDVSLTSQIGRGSRFSFTLPLSDE